MRLGWDGRNGLGPATYLLDVEGRLDLRDVLIQVRLERLDVDGVPHAPRHGDDAVMFAVCNRMLYGLVEMLDAYAGKRLTDNYTGRRVVVFFGLGPVLTGLRSRGTERVICMDVACLSQLSPLTRCTQRLHERQLAIPSQISRVNDDINPAVVFNCVRSPVTRRDWQPFCTDRG